MQTFKELASQASYVSVHLMHLNCPVNTASPIRCKITFSELEILVGNLSWKSQLEISVGNLSWKSQLEFVVN